MNNTTALEAQISTEANQAKKRISNKSSLKENILRNQLVNLYKLLLSTDSNRVEARASVAKTPSGSKKEDKMGTDSNTMREFNDTTAVGNYKGVSNIVAKVHAIGSFVLSEMYHNGCCVDVDHYTEVLYLEKAAAQGFRPAIFNLAIAHAADTWIALDTAKSIQMMSKLADGGYAPAVEMMKGLDEATASSTDRSSRYAQRAMLHFMAK